MRGPGSVRRTGAQCRNCSAADRRCPRLPSKGSPCFTWPSPGPSFLTGGTPRAFLVCCLRFCWITTVPLDLLHLPAPIDEVGHAPSLSQRSGSLWHSPVQKLKDSTTYGERPGSTKANNRVRILPSSCISPNLWCLRRENLCRGRQYSLLRGPYITAHSRLPHLHKDTGKKKERNRETKKDEEKRQKKERQIER